MKVISSTCIFFSSLLVLVSGCSQTKTQEQQLADNQIVNIMMTVDKGEIAASQEAAKKAVTPQVTQYANYLIQQHQKNLEELTQLAKQLNLDPKESTISQDLMSQGKQDLKNLEQLSGPAFDKAYINAMVKGHQAGLELIDSKLVPQTKNPQLKEFVKRFREMVSTHLEKAREIQRTLT